MRIIPAGASFILKMSRPYKLTNARFRIFQIKKMSNNENKAKRSVKQLPTEAIGFGLFS